MKNTKIKIICAVVLVIVVIFGIRFCEKWSQDKMIETVQNRAEAAGLKITSIELSEYDRGQFKGHVYIECSNFAKMDWDTLFSMHEDLLNVQGVEDVIYSKYTYGYGYTIYEINLDEDMIRCYGGENDIDYYGSWENGKKHYTVSTEDIKDYLANRENESSNTSDKNTNNSSNTSDRETDAKVCAVKAVKDNLKSPSTAEFCKYTEMTATNLGGEKWKITGWVDAQNSFGATVRENWTVTLTLTSSGFKDATVTFS